MRAESARSLPEVTWQVNERDAQGSMLLFPSDFPLGEVGALGKPPRGTVFEEAGVTQAELLMAGIIKWSRIQGSQRPGFRQPQAKQGLVLSDLPVSSSAKCRADEDQIMCSLSHPRDDQTPRSERSPFDHVVTHAFFSSVGGGSGRRPDPGHGWLCGAIPLPASRDFSAWDSR